MNDYPKFSEPEVITAEPLAERIYDAAVQAEPNPEYQRIANRTLRFLIDRGVIAFVDDCPSCSDAGFDHDEQTGLSYECEWCHAIGKVVVPK